MEVPPFRGGARSLSSSEGEPPIRQVAGLGAVAAPARSIRRLRRPPLWASANVVQWGRRPPDGASVWIEWVWRS